MRFLPDVIRYQWNLYFFSSFCGLQEGLTLCFIVVEDVCYIRSCHVDRASIIFI